MKYQLHPKVLNVTMRNNIVLKDKTKQLDGSAFDNPEKLVELGFLVKVEEKTKRGRKPKDEGDDGKDETTD